jgi:hypothetical protein
VYTVIWWGDVRERGHFEDLGVGGRNVLRWIFRKWYGGMDWIGWLRIWRRRRAVVSAIPNLRVP